MLVGEMTWPEYEANVKKSVIFLPVGSTEQHGPHLPLNVDQICPTEIAKLVADEIDGMVLPVIPYGYKSQPESGDKAGVVGRAVKNCQNLVDCPRRPRFCQI